MIFAATIRFAFSRVVTDSLKLLNLKLPTSQQEIKTRYR